LEVPLSAPLVTGGGVGATTFNSGFQINNIFYCLPHYFQREVIVELIPPLNSFVSFHQRRQGNNYVGTGDLLFVQLNNCLSVQ
jgi:hypothetical protein